VYCMFAVLLEEKTKVKGTRAGRRFSGGQQNDFRKQKLKGFSFVRIYEKEENFL
jgi:hypothetical protein